MQLRRRSSSASVPEDSAHTIRRKKKCHGKNGNLKENWLRGDDGARKGRVCRSRGADGALAAHTHMHTRRSRGADVLEATNGALRRSLARSSRARSASLSSQPRRSRELAGAGERVAELFLSLSFSPQRLQQLAPHALSVSLSLELLERRRTNKSRRDRAYLEESCVGCMCVCEQLALLLLFSPASV